MVSLNDSGKVSLGPSGRGRKTERDVSRDVSGTRGCVPFVALPVRHLVCRICTVSHSPSWCSPEEEGVLLF